MTEAIITLIKNIKKALVDKFTLLVDQLYELQNIYPKVIRVQAVLSPNPFDKFIAVHITDLPIKWTYQSIPLFNVLYEYNNCFYHKFKFKHFLT